MPHADGFEVTIAVGGHPLPFVIRADGTVERPGRPGTLLGIFPDIDVHRHRIVLRDGDQIVLWTDGVGDRRGDGGLFGEDRLRELLVANADRRPAEIADAIEAAVLDFSQTTAAGRHRHRGPARPSRLARRATGGAATPQVVRAESGQTMAEYAVVLGVITIAVVVTLKLLSTGIKGVLTNVIAAL